MPYRIVQQPEAETEERPKFRIVEKVPGKEEKIAEEFKFFGWKPTPETIEKIRHPSGVALKGLAGGIIGSPGDLLTFFQRLVGVKEPKTILPTSENVGKMFETLAGEEFEPRNLPEEFGERGFQFLGSILGLGGPLKGTTAAKTLNRNIMAAFLPAGVSVATEKAKLPTWLQISTTLGTSFLTHRLTGKSLRDIENALYSKANEIAGDVKIPAKSLETNLNNIIKQLERGGIEASDKEALRKISDSMSHIKNNEIAVNDLMAVKRKINEARGQLFAKDLGKVGVKSARRNLNKVSRQVDQTIGKFDNPEFQRMYKQANELHAGIADTNRITNWLFDNKLLTGSAGLLVKMALPAYLTKGIGVLGAVQLGKMLKTLATNPGYRKSYIEILKNAAKEDIRATATSVKKFNKKTEELLPELSEY